MSKTYLQICIERTEHEFASALKDLQFQASDGTMQNIHLLGTVRRLESALLLRMAYVAAQEASK